MSYTPYICTHTHTHGTVMHSNENVNNITSSKEYVPPSVDSYSQHFLTSKQELRVTVEICKQSKVLLLLLLLLLLLHTREHKQGLGLKTCSFKPQGVLGLSIFSWVFQHSVLLGVDTEKPVCVGGFCTFFPGGLTSSSDIILRLLSGCSLLTNNQCQDSSGSPNL
jgi:hypothetical protein